MCQLVDYSEVSSLGYSYTSLVYSSLLNMMREIYLWSGLRQKCTVAWLLFFFFLRVINYHVNLCSTAAVHFYFGSTAVQHWSRWVPRSPHFLPTFRNIIIPYVSGWRRGRGTVWQRRETWAGKQACLELSSHRRWKERARKLATNTRTQTHARHTPHRSRGVCEQPRSSYLGCLGSLCSAPPSAPSLQFFPPVGSSGAGVAAVAGWRCR